MMRHVRVGNIVEDLVQDSVVSVNGSQSSPQPIPLGRIVVRQGRMRVLQVSDQHEETIDNQKRDSVEADHRGHSLRGGVTEETVADGEDASVGDVYLETLAVVVDGSVGVEMASEAAVVRSSRDVEG